MSEDIDEAAPSAAHSPQLACLAEVASQAWRLSRLSKRAAEKLPDPDGARLASQVRYINRRLEEELRRAGLRMVDLDGERFDPGMAASALNAEDFNSDDDLCVDQTIEPVIMGPNGVLKYGVVMLARVHS